MSDKISASLKVYAAMPCLDGIAMPGINVVQRPVDGGYFAPLLIHIAQAQGHNPAVLGLIWTFAGGAHLFVYQSGALVVGHSYASSAPKISSRSL